jgi:hypothetical protein
VTTAHQTIEAALGELPHRPGCASIVSCPCTCRRKESTALEAIWGALEAASGRAVYAELLAKDATFDADRLRCAEFKARKRAEAFREALEPFADWRSISDMSRRIAALLAVHPDTRASAAPSSATVAQAAENAQPGSQSENPQAFKGEQQCGNG